MSVLRCSRGYCENIRCRAMIDGNYICDMCTEELKQYMEYLPPITRKEFDLLVKSFINSNVGDYDRLVQSPQDLLNDMLIEY